MSSRRRSNMGASGGPQDEVVKGSSKKVAAPPPDLLAADKFDLVADDFAVDDSQEDLELKELERRLNTEVEEDLFEEPRKFK